MGRFQETRVAGLGLHREAKRSVCRLLAAVGILCFFLANPLRADDLSPRDAAKAQFDTAEMQRAEVESKPEIARSLKEYTGLVAAYRKVYLITPLAVEDPAAINEVAGLYRTMGDLFDEKYYRSAVETYQFLLHDYPDSRYREDALLAVAHIEQENLHAPDLAKSTYEEFLALHPRSSHVAEVRASIAGLEASAAQAPSQSSAPSAASVARAAASPVPAQSVKATAPATVAASSPAPAPSEAAAETAADDSQPANNVAAKHHGEVSNIRTWNAENYTRVVIDVGSQVKYQASRIPNPDRIFFDIENSSLASTLLHKSVAAPNGGFVKDIRVAQNQPDMIRVVLDVTNAKDYSVFYLPDPDRLIVDVYGDTAASKGQTLEADRQKESPSPATQPATKTSGSQPPSAESPKIASATANQASTKVLSSDRQAANAASKPAQTQVAENDVPSSEIQKQEAASTKTALSSKTGDAEVVGTSAAAPGSFTKSASPADLTKPALPVGAAKQTKATASADHEQAAVSQPPSIPEPTRTGQQSLSRALGLKIGRIVIDPGHGGHDTGTIGPGGLMEKDLCLDVALRLGKLISQRLPGAEVVYTRDDDTFIPLEQRTEIANEAHADLFLSIHANSSSSRSARGVETYYLNVDGTSSAMEVAARENALSDNSVHDLQDLVSRIAQTDKIAESRDFASDIQDSLAKRMDNLRGEPNRGVRKAPFVVLIGADMPSVLAEISFLSNPGDEQWLKKPENRERVAEGLYQGIESYLHSTNSLSVDKNPSAARTGSHSPAAASRPGIVARAGNPE